MKINRLPIIEGWHWFGEGWRIFLLSPVMWLVLTLVWFILVITLHFLPYAGIPMIFLLTPALYAGFLYGARELDEGKDLEFRHLFQGLLNKDSRVSFLLMGAVIALVALVLTAAGVQLGGDTSVFAPPANIDPQSLTASEAVDPKPKIALFILHAAYSGFLISLLFLYSCPLMEFHLAKPKEAIKTSFEATLDNSRPLVLFSILYFVLGAICSATLGIGFLLLFPVTYCALYASYKSVFVSADAARPASPAEASEGVNEVKDDADNTSPHGDGE